MYQTLNKVSWLVHDPSQWGPWYDSVRIWTPNSAVKAHLRPDFQASYVGPWLWRVSLDKKWSWKPFLLFQGSCRCGFIGAKELANSPIEIGLTALLTVPVLSSVSPMRQSAWTVSSPGSFRLKTTTVIVVKPKVTFELKVLGAKVVKTTRYFSNTRYLLYNGKWHDLTLFTGFHHAVFWHSRCWLLQVTNWSLLTQCCPPYKRAAWGVFAPERTRFTTTMNTVSLLVVLFAVAA